MDRQPEVPVRMEVLCDGCTIGANASITFLGTAPEVLVVPSSGFKRGVVDMTSVTGLSVSLIEDGFLTVKAINATGQPVTKLEEVSASVASRFFANSGRIRRKPQGELEIGDFQMMIEPDADVREGDIVTAIAGIEAGRIGRVVDVDRIFDFDGVTHHFEAVMENIN